MKCFFSIVLIFYISIIVHAQDTDSIKVDILLDNVLLEQSDISTKFINAVEYTSDGYILLSSPTQFYLLGLGGIATILESWSDENDIESFTVSSDGRLLIVSGNTLYQAYQDPPFVVITDIPDSGMDITSKYNEIYVFDRILKDYKRNYSIYQISENIEITPLVTMPTPILSVFELPGLLIFSTKNILFSMDIKTKNLFQILVLPQEDDIFSIVGDTINHAFYFSTDNAIYRIKDRKFEIITEEFGGSLRYDREGLLIFNPEKQLIIRLRSNLLYSVAD